MKKTLGLAEWWNQNEDYPEKNDRSKVELFEEDGGYFLEVACNDVNLLVQVYKPNFTDRPYVDETRLDKKYPICADSFSNVAFVAERLGLRLV